MHFLELDDRHARLDFGGAQFGVSKQGLDETNVGAVFQHVRRASMAKQVAGAAQRAANLSR